MAPTPKTSRPGAKFSYITAERRTDPNKMAYLVLAVIVLLVIGCITTAVLARFQWRWFHITATIITCILAAIFPFFVAGSLKARSAWHELHEDLETRTATLKVEQRELKFGDEAVSGGPAGVVELSQQLSRLSLDAGRRWRNLRRTNVNNNQVTLVRPQPQAVEGVPAEPAAADPAALQRQPMATEGLIVYGFAESMDQQIGQPVPTNYLGEYRVVSSTPDSITVTPVAKLNPAQLNGLNNATQWTLYELLPLDSHEVFLALGSSPTDDNVLGRIDAEAVNRTLGGNVQPGTLQAYLDDGRRSLPDDPLLTRWMRVEFIKPFKIDVSDTRLTTPVASGGYFDGIGRAVDGSLKGGDEQGNVSFKVGDSIVLKEEAAAPLIEEKTAKLIDRFYLRPLNDYRYILRRIQLEVTELRSRIEELNFEATVLRKAIDKTNGMIVIRQDRKNKLEQDLAQYKLERQAVEGYLAEMKQQVQQTQSRMQELNRNNLALEKRLEEVTQSVSNRVNSLTAMGN